MTDPFDSDEWRAFVDHVNTDLIPKLGASAMTISICPGEKGADVKFAVELGLSIMMDKPIIAVMPPGNLVPKKLRAIADIIIIGDPADPEMADKLKSAMTKMMKRINR